MEYKCYAHSYYPYYLGNNDKKNMYMFSTILKTCFLFDCKTGLCLTACAYYKVSATYN